MLTNTEILITQINEVTLNIYFTELKCRVFFRIMKQGTKRVDNK